MNHTGVCGTDSRRHALRKAESYVAVGWEPEGLALALTTKSLARPACPFVPGPRAGPPGLPRAPGARSLNAMRP
ncbi:hypothetical protein GCM10010365_53190 [Streptomyces poonensis]|uniref:Uncharacterized protein n=1 Tax=Streptomyces poonensis TaxID=68255 RepID=A0A918PYD4_9ACTN|nr:hypothetical protein GCM10010365_53190 [Streptomyces poonensis]GLJ89017.1 hypothetical protein GCM10017589_16170 [Streptomyces poonensis]